MINLIFTIVLLVIAIRVMKKVNRNSDIFDEFKQSKILSVLIFSYPAVSVLMGIGALWIPIIPLYLLAILCFIPAALIAKKQSLAFQCAGTDRVTDAKEAMSQVVVGAFIGVISISVLIVFELAEIGLNS